MVDSTLPVQGEKVRSLVGELRSRLLHGEAKKKTERERDVFISPRSMIIVILKFAMVAKNLIVKKEKKIKKESKKLPGIILLLIHFHYLKTTLSSQILQNRHRLDSWAGRLLTPEVPGSGAQWLQDQRGKCGNC